MKTKISRGKFENLQKLADDEGTLSILGLDKPFNSTSKTEPVCNLEQSIEFKQIVSEYLSNTASGILFDRLDGMKVIQHAGVLTDYDVFSKNSLLSLNRLAHAKTNAVKVTFTYNPHTDAKTNDQKLARLERLGAEALAADLPLFVAPLTYDDNVADKTSPEFAKLQPSLVIDTLKELTKQRYHIDILEIEIPLNFDFVEGFTAPDQPAVYSKREAAKLLKEASDTTTRPFVYQNGLDTMATFNQAVKFAGQSGAKFSGAVASYTAWSEALTSYLNQGEVGLKNWLETVGKPNLENLNNILENYATPWYDRFGGLKSLDLFDNPIEL